MSARDNQSKSDKDIDGDSSSDEEAPAVPEIEFEPQLSPEQAEQAQPDAQFRSKHPLFDAPDLIDDHDELNDEGKLSSDDEDEDIPPKEEQAEKSDEQNAGGSNIEQPPDNADGGSLLTAEPEEGTDIPEWKLFHLPPTPNPDDTEIDAEIQERFDIAKLLQQIRAT